MRSEAEVDFETTSLASRCFDGQCFLAGIVGVEVLASVGEVHTKQ